MKLGLFVPLTAPVATPAFVETLGLEAEALGFDSLWLAEHVVLFDDHASRYPYAPDGRFPASGEAGFLDPFGALGFLAGVTSCIRLGTGICLVPQRNPVYVAKEVATADWLSRGRFDFGVGVGWLAEEFDAVAAPFADLGQGWYGFNLDPPGFAERMRRLDALLAQAGRSRRELTVSVSPYLRATCEADLAAYAAAGADQVILATFARDADGLRRRLADLAATLLPAAHRL